MFRQKSLPYVFLVPTILILMILAFVPLGYAINLSFKNMTLFRPDSQYVGFENFINLWSDRRFVNALWVSAKWQVITVTATMVAALFMGILMFETLTPRQRNILCLIFLIPVLLPRVCAAFVWRFAFHPLYGIFTYPYRAITGEPLEILSNPNLALWAVAYVDLWQWGFFFAVIIVKLLEALPHQPVEAARLDHAKTWEIHAFVTLPMLRAQLVALTLVKAIESLRSFDLIYIMTRGGPGISTETLDMYAFSQGFIESGRISYASSMAVIMLLLTIVIFTWIWEKGARMNISRQLGRAFLFFMAFMVLFPLFWTALNAFKENADILTRTPKFLFTPVTDNIIYVLSRPAVLQALINSLVICLVSVVIGSVLGFPAAYAIARHPSRITEELQFFVLSLRFLPPVAVAIPLMVIWLNMGLYDTRIAMIATYSLLTISITIWLAVPGFQQVPKEVEEAARVDGYGAYSVFFRIALPVAARTLMGAIAFSFVLIWNEFLIALMLTASDARTLPIMASEMSQLGMDVPWGILNAAVILLSIPPLLLLGLLSSFMNSVFFKDKR